MKEGVPRRSSFRLGRTCYFAPIAIASLNASGRVVAANLALRRVLDLEPEIMRGRSLDEVAESLGERLTGALDGAGDQARCEVRSQGYGTFELTTNALPNSGEEGRPGGSIRFWELRSIEKEAEFRRDHQSEVLEQLTWEGYALSYDRVLLEQPYYLEVIDRHVGALAAPDVKKVLDLGAGTGNVALRLVEAGREVTAVELNRAMLERLHEKSRAIGARDLEILEADGERLGFLPSESFDGVNVLLVFFCMIRPRAGFGEALRVLRPGGRIVITEPKRDFQRKVVLEKVDERLAEIGRSEELGPDRDRVFKANERIDPRRRELRGLNQPSVYAEDVFEFLMESGFTELLVQDSHFGQCATIQGRKPL